MSDSDTQNDAGARNELAEEAQPSNFLTKGLQAAQNPLLAKIKSLFQQTTITDWREFGDVLQPEQKYTRFVERLEHGYLLELPTGRLFLRNSQRVSGQFFAGGYQYKPNGPGRFFIELRSSTWNPKSLTESTLRFAAGSEESFQILAEGEVAEQIYKEIRQKLEQHKLGSIKQFDQEAKEFLNRFHEIVDTLPSDHWEKAVTPDGFELWYRGTVEEFRLEFGKSARDARPQYRLNISKGRELARTIEGNIAQAFFDLVDTRGQRAGLEALDHLLSTSLKKS